MGLKRHVVKRLDWIKLVIRAVPWLRRLVVGLTPQRPESVYVGIVDK
jgi:hypothetical protein